jgi:type II secretory ATPase GspE/PulE/Tfp pilus assembly ATPase PilB-like protein
MSATPPDITDKMALARRAAAAAAPVQFLWPAPPGFEFTNGDAKPYAEECVLVFKDGAKAKGALLEFLPDEGVLKFQQASAPSAISIAFTAILGLNLLRPVALRREALQIGQQPDQEVFAPSERQPFTVTLVNGQLFQGETVGYVHALCGLFLFQPEQDGSVIRGFVPAPATKTLTIGKPIGQMLVDQKVTSAEVIDAALQKQATMRVQRFGEYLTENRIVSQEQLSAALKQQRAQPVQKLGEALVQLGYLTPGQLEEALAIEARNRSIPLGQILQDMGVVDAEVINAVMAKKMGIPYIDLQKFRISPEALKRIPQAVAQRYQILPVAESENSLVVAIANPTNMAKMEELRFVAGMKLVPVMASAEDIRRVMETSYAAAADAPESPPLRPIWEARGTDFIGRSVLIDIGIEQLTSRLAAESGELDLDEHQAAQSDSTLVKLVNKIILDAVEQKASDIHLETNPSGKSMRIRFRKDGALVTYLDMPSRFRKAVVSRIKIMSQLDITERRKPQDGKIDFARFGPARVELRVATIPTANGLEDVVMRVLSAATPVPIDQLGLDPMALIAIKRMISRPHGLFLVCGPTGSGKTTTLHSLLGFLNTPDLKIWTAEDPIEISQPGLRQVQVNAKIGWTFAAAMRAFMRADPDVIMVGEMRDAETAKTGVEASLTGHLVFSTLHTNSAAESVVRLLDLGMDPFNFADALLGVLAQRLIRRLCANCRTAYVPASNELDELAHEYCGETELQPDKLLQVWRKQHGGSHGRITLFRAPGCPECDRTGYKGRMGLYELLVADPAVKRLVQTRAPVTEIVTIALAKGMRTLKQDGIEKVLQGVTDMHQVRTV